MNLKKLTNMKTTNIYKNIKEMKDHFGINGMNIEKRFKFRIR